MSGNDDLSSLSLEDKGFTTRAVNTHLPKERYDTSTALAPPILMASVYRTPVDYVLNDPSHYMYGRYGNVSRDGVEAVLAGMEGARDAYIFASGMAAINAVVETLHSGDHVVASKQMYGGAYDMFRTELSKISIGVTFVDDVDVAMVKAALKPETKLVWLEICTNPLLKLMDVAAMARAVHGYNKDIIFGVDNTFLTPYIIQPLSLGVDVVMHSATKFLGGHSDTLLGALSTNHPDLGKKLRAVQKYRGATPSSFDCYLLHRSLLTLEIRMDRHHSNSLELAKFLEKHPCVEKVMHPLLPSHPSNALALKQNGGKHSGALSFYIKDAAKTKKFMSSLRLVGLAVSLGGVHTTASVPTLLSHSFLNEEERRATGITSNLVRVSVGIENIEDLKADFDQALKKSSQIISEER